MTLTLRASQFAYTPILCLFSIGGSLSTTVQAQVLEEVIVYAQKREQNLQEVPIAVSAFTGEMLVQSGVKDVFELSSNTPSLIVSANQSSTSTTFGIRGVFTSSQNFGLESSVGLYVDGIYRARQSSMINNLVDVASVEVLRGPQGTLFGRNTPAGALLINSVKPDHEGTGFLEATAGDLNLLSANGAASFSAIDDVLAFRVTGFTMERDGFVDLWLPREGGDGIEVHDDVVNDRDRWGARLQALYTPSDNLSVHFIADHSEIDETCCGSSTWKNNMVAQGLPPGSPPKTGSDTNILNLGGTVLNQNDFYEYNMSTSFAPRSENEDQGISVQVDWQTESLLFTSITAYRSFDSTDNLDVDFANVDGLARNNVGEQAQFSQELRISNEGDKFKYVAGLYYFTQDLDSEIELIAGEDLTFLVDAFGDAFPAGTGSLTVAEQEHESYAIFGQFDYNLSNNWLLTAGLRWTNEDKSMTNTFTQDASEVPPGAPGFNLEPGWGFWLFPPAAPRSDVDEEIDDNQLTGTVKLSWFANDATMFYASYGTGYKAGGVNTDRIESTLNAVFDAEESESLELGMKADFPEQALRVNLALHVTNTDDLQTISFQGTGFALKNAGTAETYGGELDVDWQATDGLSLTLRYAYNKAEYADFEDGPCWIGSPWQADQPDPRDNGDGSCDRSGGMVAGNPENVLHLSANWAFGFTDDITGFLYGEYSYTDERMTDVNNDPEKLDGGYELVNLRAGLIFERWDAQLTAWGRNVFDEDFVTTITDTVIQDGNFTAYHNETLTWGITLRKNF